MTNKFQHLFTPLKIGPVTVQNRIFQGPHRKGYGEHIDHQYYTLSEREAYYVAERAKGGVGLIIVPCAYNDFGMNLPMHPALDDDKWIPGLNRLTDAIHEYDVKVFAQLLHLGSSLWAMPDGSPPVSASAVRSKLTGVIPRELTVPEIKETIAHFAEGSARAKEGGFDGVEFAGTGGYLFNQFLFSYQFFTLLFDC